MLVRFKLQWAREAHLYHPVPRVGTHAALVAQQQNCNCTAVGPLLHETGNFT